MKRAKLIQELFNKTNFKTYLEIGCYKGKTFLAINAKRKIAVDPFFHPIFIKDVLINIVKTPKSITNRYFKETSDNFFLKRQQFLKKVAPLDVVLVDGLHTFEASLKDVLHVLLHLNKNGVIIMHDCYPPNKAAALPTKSFPTSDDLKGVEGWTGAWNGDVWKAIVYLRRCHSNVLDVCVINSDCGLGIVKLKEDINNEVFTINQQVFFDINKLTYEDLIENVESFLNLKSPEYADVLIKEVVDSNAT